MGPIVAGNAVTTPPFRIRSRGSVGVVDREGGEKRSRVVIEREKGEGLIDACEINASLLTVLTVIVNPFL